MPSEYFRAIIDSIGNPIFVKNGQRRFVFANDAACEMLGIRREQWLGKTDHELFPKEQADIFREHDLQLLKVGGKDVNEEQITDAQGEIRTIVTTKTLYISETGEKYIVGVIQDITDRKRLEEAVKRAEAKYRAIFENASIGIFQTTTQGRIVIANPALARMFGYDSPQELMDSFTDMGTRAYGNHLDRLKLPELCLKHGFVEGFETQLYTKDRSKRWVSINAKPIMDGEGKIVCFEGTIEDIDVRKCAEKELRKSEGRFRHLVDRTPLPLCFVSKDGFLIYINSRFLEVFGYTLEDIPTLEEWWRLAYPDEQYRRWVIDTWNAAVKTSAEHGTDTRPTEYNVTCKNGAVRNVEISGITIEDNFLATFVDVTERKRAEETIRQSETTLRSLIDATREPLLLIDREGTILVANQMAAQRFGKSVKELIGTCQYDYFPPHIAARRKAEYDGVVRTGNPVHFQDERAGKAYDSYGYPVFGDEGRVTQVAIFVYDVTERKALEAQLLQAQKMEAIGTLAGGIAHDFNNILMSIMGYAGLMEAKIPEDDPLRSYVREINKSTNKAANVTRSLLAFSRKQSMELKPLGTNTIIKDVEKLLRRIVPEDVEVTFTLNEDTVIMADMTQIDQVLMNLVSNAKDAMPKGGALHIETRTVELGREFKQAYGFGEPGRYAVISVADNGVGMDEDTQKKVFEPFFTTKEIGKGTGLGLSIVYGIVQQHGGYITVSSQLGEGTTFEIYLPAVKMAAMSDAGVAPSRTPGGTETLLLAEDDGDVRKTAKEILRVSGYTVVEAKDGEDAVRKYVEHHDKIDLVILDVVMPVKNGREAYDAIRKMNPFVRVLFISGYTGDVILDKGVKDTAVDFISKPLSADELLTKIREALERQEDRVQ